MVELEIDPKNPKAADEKYILFSNDENKSFYQELTIKDNFIPNGRKLLIEFIDLMPKLNYSLKVDSGDGEPYFVFENVPFIDLIEENDNGFKGIIRFTNGVPYYYIEDGTAQIEKINDDIIITMLYMPTRRHIDNIPNGYQFPATLILEF